MNHKHFTLIELFVSISIILALASLLQPSLHRMQESAYSSICQNNLRQLMIGVHIYSDENDDVLVPFAGPYAEGPYYSLSNWTGKIIKILDPKFNKPKFESVDDFKMASCPSSDQRFGYGHNYTYIGAESRSHLYPSGFKWLILKKRHEGTIPNRTTVLVDNILTKTDPAPNTFSYWRSFVRSGSSGLKDNVVNFIHYSQAANVGWLDGSVSSRYLGDGYVDPGNPQVNKDWWSLVK